MTISSQPLSALTPFIRNNMRKEHVGSKLDNSKPQFPRDAGSFSVCDYPFGAMKEVQNRFLDDLRQKFTNLPANEVCALVRSSVNVGNFEITIGNEDIPDLSNEYYQALDAFLYALPSFPNITTVHLQYFDVNKEMLNALSQLVNLRHLFVKDCYFRHGTVNPLLRLETFVCQSTQIDAFDDEAHDPTLHFFSPSDIRQLCIDHHTVFDAFMNHIPQLYPVLASLSIPPTDLDPTDLIGLLSHCPELRFFKIYGPYDEWIDLPPSVLPHLTTYSGPAELARAFVCGRPVDSIQVKLLDTEHPSSEILRSLTQSTVPIRQLYLHGLLGQTKEIFASICELFPALEKLVVSFDLVELGVHQLGVSDGEWRSDFVDLNSVAADNDDDQMDVDPTTPTAQQCHIQIINPDNATRTHVQVMDETLLAHLSQMANTFFAAHADYQRKTNGGTADGLLAALSWALRHIKNGLANHICLVEGAVPDLGSSVDPVSATEWIGGSIDPLISAPSKHEAGLKSRDCYLSEHITVSSFFKVALYLLFANISLPPTLRHLEILQLHPENCGHGDSGGAEEYGRPENLAVPEPLLRLLAALVQRVHSMQMVVIRKEVIVPDGKPAYR